MFVKSGTELASSPKHVEHTPTGSGCAQPHDRAQPNRLADQVLVPLPDDLELVLLFVQIELAGEAPEIGLAHRPLHVLGRSAVALVQMLHVHRHQLKTT